MNTLSINIPSNFIWSLNNTLERVAEATSESQIRGILDRQTIQGIKWAIEFVEGLTTCYMSEAELKHAIRLTTFRGNVKPVFHN